DEAGAVRRAAHVKDGDDVWVVETGDGAGFGQVRFGVGGLGDELGVRNLDGDGPLQLVVVGQIDEAEAALAQDLLDAVSTNVLRHIGDGVNGGGSVCGSRLVRTCFVGGVHEHSPSSA